MTIDRKAEYLATLRAEEIAGVKAIAFWERQPTIELVGREWVGPHLEGLKKQLEGTRQAIRIMETKSA